MRATHRRALAALAIAATSGALAVTASGQEPTSSPPTVTKRGTVGKDMITGTSKRDVIDALAGDDTVSAGAGNDVVFGGTGDDRLSGGAGDDQLQGGSGDDTLTGGSGHDDLDGGSGNDTLNARDGVRDDVFCGSGTDTAVVDRKDNVYPDCEHVRRN